MFIAIDGPNGAGKTTLARRLAEEVAAAGKQVLYTKEPTLSGIGVYARVSEQDLRGWPLAALYVADRHLHVLTEISPALASGSTVVCDRYVAATLVLQRLDGLDRLVLREMNRGLLRPDVSIILLTEPRLLRQRLSERTILSRFEQMPDISQREYDLYLEVAADLRLLGHNVEVIDATTMSVDQLVSSAQTLIANANDR